MFFHIIMNVRWAFVKLKSIVCIYYRLCVHISQCVMDSFLFFSVPIQYIKMNFFRRSAALKYSVMQ